jgi:hypothetical protein
MHIKKNVFKNIFNMVIYVKRKKKDNINARINIALLYDYCNMRLFNDGVRVVKSEATF